MELIKGFFAFIGSLFSGFKTLMPLLAEGARTVGRESVRAAKEFELMAFELKTSELEQKYEKDNFNSLADKRAQGLAILSHLKQQKQIDPNNNNQIKGKIDYYEKQLQLIETQRQTFNISHYENGNIKRKVSLYDKTLNGPSVLRYDNGQLKLEADFKHGEFVNGISYYLNGKTMSSAKSDPKSNTINATFYDEDGALAVKLSVFNKKKVEVCIHFTDEIQFRFKSNIDAIKPNNLIPKIIFSLKLILNFRVMHYFYQEKKKTNDFSFILRFQKLEASSMELVKDCKEQLVIN